MKKNWTIGLWPGSGYLLTQFHVAASCLEEALDKIVTELIGGGLTDFYLTESQYRDYLEQTGQDPEENELGDEYYRYIDATMEGAPFPVYLMVANMKAIEA